MFIDCRGILASFFFFFIRVSKPYSDLTLNLSLPDKSELDRLTGSSNSLAVDNILHRAFINVSLSGTEAAAATLVKVSG